MVEPEDIEVVASETKPPPLLAVCRQIRQEAISILYNENVFHFIFRGCDGSLVIAWARHFKHYSHVDREKRSVSHEHRGRPNWANLVKWARGLYDVDAYFEKLLAHDEYYDEWEAVIASVHGVLWDAAGEKTEVKATWQEVEKILQHLHLAVRVMDSRWA